MIQSIEQYLSQLRKELSGYDRATIQDALSDAEEHLRTALSNAMTDDNVSEPDALAQVIEKYGMPEEVATAYGKIEHLITPALTHESRADESEEPAEKDGRPFPVRFFGIFTDPRAW
ncbi:MAG: hypothetical protein PHN78_08070, partial [Dehalococcoidales bacterium]|nr:hypothetical protein [Dehalococcoidales bacterium]